MRALLGVDAQRARARAAEAPVLLLPLPGGWLPAMTRDDLDGLALAAVLTRMREVDYEAALERLRQLIMCPVEEIDLLEAREALEDANALRRAIAWAILTAKADGRDPTHDELLRGALERLYDEVLASLNEV